MTPGNKNMIVWWIVGVVVVLGAAAAVAGIIHNRKENHAMDAMSSSQSQGQSQPTVPPNNPPATPSAAASAVPAGTTANIPLPKGYELPADCQNLAFGNSIAVLNTTMGQIKIELYYSDAPLAVSNFVCLIHEGYYNGIIFHRILKPLVIQAGDPTGTGAGGKTAFVSTPYSHIDPATGQGVFTFGDELNPATASYQTGYVNGTVAMANAGPNTNGSQFFIVTSDQANQAFSKSYTIFGKVVAGLDVIQKIEAVPITGGPGATDGKPLTPVVITSATIEPVVSK